MLVNHNEELDYSRGKVGHVLLQKLTEELGLEETKESLTTALKIVQFDQERRRRSDKQQE